MRRSVVALAIAASLVLVTGTAAADPRADVEKARAAFLARNYGEAEARARSVLDPQSGTKERPLVSQARMILGAALYVQNKREGAKQTFEKLILEDPTYEPDPLAYPREVVNAFIDTKTELAETLKNAAATTARLEAERKAREAYEREQQERWLERVKALAQEDKTTVKNRRLVAFMPFGAGQFQNNQTLLGWAFLGTEAALVVTSGILFGMQRYAQNRAQEEQNARNPEGKAEQYDSIANDLFIGSVAVTSAFVLVTAAGILHANLTFVPEYVDVKKRELPPLSGIKPVIATTPNGDGVYVGLRGLTF